MSERQRDDAEQRPSWADLALGGGLFGVAVLSGLFVESARADTVEPTTWWHWMLIVTPALLVVVRRMRPIEITLLAAVAQAAIWVSGLPDVLLPLIVILYTTSADAGRVGRRVAIAVSAALTVVTAIGVSVADDVTLSQLPLIVLTCGTAIWLGWHAERQRSIAIELATTVTRERERAEYARTAAVATERSNIARELHDVIGHTLTVIAVRAEAADRVAATQPAAAAEAVQAIAGASRAALDDTRRVLAGLRESSTAELAPPPDIAAIERLITELAQTGVGATLSCVGCDASPPPPVVAAGAYRIVQESLTNAIKYGVAGEAITVTLRCSGAGIEVTVVNLLDADAARSPGGSGLAGMAERAEVLGGTFEADRTDDRFTIYAVLPYFDNADRSAT